MAWCDHPRSGSATESKVVNSGRDAQANGVRIPTFDLLPYEDENSGPTDRYSWEQW